MIENKMKEFADMFGIELGEKFKLQLAQSNEFLKIKVNKKIVDANFILTERGIEEVIGGRHLFYPWVIIKSMLTGQAKVVKIE